MFPILKCASAILQLTKIPTEIAPTALHVEQFMWIVFSLMRSLRLLARDGSMWV